MNEPIRDQATSTFTAILELLVRSQPGAVGAALVDSEGETVDYAGRLPPFEVKVTAAHWIIVLSETSELDRVGRIAQMTARAANFAYHVRRLDEGYAIVLVLHPRLAFAVSERAMHQALTGIAREAGFDGPSREVRWFAVDVEPHHQGKAVRPRRVRVAGKLEPVEVMGAVMGLAKPEKGFRVRLANGTEVMLVRERGGRWFADDHVS